MSLKALCFSSRGRPLVQTPVAGSHIPLALSGDGVLTTRTLAVLAYTVSGAVVSLLSIFQEILTNLWEDLREVCSQVTLGWMAKNKIHFMIQ